MMSDNFDYILNRLPESMKEEFKEVVKRYKASMSEVYDRVHDRGSWHVKATPLVEVLSVTAHLNPNEALSNEVPCQIYGKIEVVEGREFLFDLYNRGEEESEVVGTGEPLSLSGPCSCPVVPSHSSKLRICLYDRARGSATIASGTVDMRFRRVDESESVEVFKVEGQVGYVALMCNFLRSAVIAKVDVKLLKYGDESDSQLTDLYGRIVAKFRNNYGYSKNLGEEFFAKPERDHFTSKLFHRTQEAHVSVSNGNSIQLSRSLVAVPAYATLVVGVGLVDHCTNQRIVTGRAKFEASDFGTVEVDIKPTEDQPYYARVKVCWEHLYRVCPEDEEEFDSLSMVGSPSSPRSPKSPRSLFSYASSLASPILEIFSIFLGRENEEALNLMGTVNVNYSFGSCCIFERNDNQPLKIHPPEAILLPEGPQLECLFGDELGIHVDLKDLGSHLSVKGSLGWNTHIVEGTMISWYDKFICSVIKGVCGYVAVHYIIFSAAFQANLDICLVPTDRLGNERLEEVYGSVMISYKDVPVLTEYETKYCRTTLFQNSKDNPYVLEDDSKLPLLKSAIAVPEKSTMMVHFDLYASLSGKYTHLCNEVAIAAQDRGKTIHQFQIGLLNIEIVATWRSMF